MIKKADMLFDNYNWKKIDLQTKINKRLCILVSLVIADSHCLNFIICIILPEYLIFILKKKLKAYSEQFKMKKF